MKIEEYMESELFCIFWILKLVAKNIVRRPLETQCRATSEESTTYIAVFSHLSNILIWFM